MARRMSRHEAEAIESVQRVHEGATCPSCGEARVDCLEIGNESQTGHCLTCDRDYYLRAPRLAKN